MMLVLTYICVNKLIKYMHMHDAFLKRKTIIINFSIDHIFTVVFFLFSTLVGLTEAALE